MNGTNWTTFGTSGSAVGQFMNPSALVSIRRQDLCDGHRQQQLVRMDDMNGTNWTVMSASGPALVNSHSTSRRCV